MNRSFAALLSTLCILLVRAAAPAAEAKPETIAQGEALLWLGLVDTNKYAESWEGMSPAFKREISKRKWQSTITQVRKPLGNVISRKPKSAEHIKDLPGAPEGEYVVVTFETSFEKRSGATEKVTLMLGQDLVWRVSSYAIK